MSQRPALTFAINRKSELAVRDQIISQIALGMATGQLNGGDLLPATAALARRLGIHKNTVSHAYSRLVETGHLVRRKGARVAIRSFHDPPSSGALDLILDEAIRSSRLLGFTPKQFRDHTLRLLERPPDSLLIVSREAQLTTLLGAELAGLPCPIHQCTLADVVANPAQAAGCLVAAHASIAPELMAALPARQPMLILRYNTIEEHVHSIRTLTRPSIIALVSVSPFVLETARHAFSPYIGDVHALREQVVDDPTLVSRPGAELAFCDWLVWQSLSGSRRESFILYKIVSDESIAQIRAALEV